MSNNVVVDFGVDIGSDKTENTYFKLRMGRGKQEVATLRQEVEAGTGKTLQADRHCVCLRFADGAETDTLVEMVAGMCPGEESAISKEGNWITCSLTEAAGDGDEGQMFKDVEAKVNDFFAEVESNAFIEFGVRSSYTFEQALEVAKANNELEDPADTAATRPSFVNFLNNVNVHLRMDIDHEFLVSVMKFANKMGAPVTPDFYEFVRKFNSVDFRVDTDGVDAFTETSQSNLNTFAWEGFSGNRDMFQELTAFKTLAGEMKLVFLLKDDTYLQLEMKMPGMQQYIEHFAPEE